MHPSSHYSMTEFRKQVNDHINLRLQRKTDIITFISSTERNPSKPIKINDIIK